MNFIFTNTLSIVFFMLFALLLHFKTPQTGQKAKDGKAQQEELKGAWELTSGSAQFTKLPEGATAVTMLQDGYFTVAYFNEADKKFIGTYGGTYTASKGKLTQTLEYNTLDSATVGTTNQFTYNLKDGWFQVKGSKDGADLQQTWARIDEVSASSPLEGTWRITGRAGQDGTINHMRRGPRKTLKILTKDRFQWIAFNTETKQFSGTGGGTYTAQNGQYTENIEFFSRDSSRVGASLSFNFKVQDGKWHHNGESSTGNKINEVWERELIK